MVVAIGAMVVGDLVFFVIVTSIDSTRFFATEMNTVVGPHYTAHNTLTRMNSSKEWEMSWTHFPMLHLYCICTINCLFFFVNTSSSRSAMNMHADLSLWSGALLLHWKATHVLSHPLQLSRDVVLTCTSGAYSIVLAVLLIYKSIYLWVGLFLAFETRKVNIEALNDARFIGLSVYCCVLTCIPLVPIGILLLTQHQARYGVLAGGIFFAVTVILCLLFIPKVREKLTWDVWGTGRVSKLFFPPLALDVCSFSS